MSRRAHIAMVSIPAHGHVNPSLVGWHRTGRGLD